MAMELPVRLVDQLRATQGAVKQSPKAKSSLFEHLFLRYGAGAHLFKPFTSNRFWNRLAWILVVLGVLGWILALWFLRGYSELP